MKKLVLVAFLYLVVAGLVSSANAATLRFDPTSYSGSAGDAIDVDVLVNPGSDQISAVDVYINFDSSVVSAGDIVTTDLFDTINQSTDTNQIYLNGIFSDATKYIDSEGILATITFTLNSSNASSLQFYCDKTQNNTSKIIKNDVNATNVIECDQLSLFSLNGGTSAPSTGGTSATSTPAPTSLPASGTAQQQQQQQQQQQAVGTVTYLPQSGIMDNLLKFSIPGVIMLLLGIAIKVFI